MKTQNENLQNLWPPEFIHGTHLLRNTEKVANSPIYLSNPYKYYSLPNLCL